MALVRPPSFCPNLDEMQHVKVTGVGDRVHVPLDVETFRAASRASHRSCGIATRVARCDPCVRDNVCVCVCVGHDRDICKTAERIKMSGEQTRVMGPRNHVLDEGCTLCLLYTSDAADE